MLNAQQVFYLKNISIIALFKCLQEQRINFFSSFVFLESTFIGGFFFYI